jgi:hypothetical protein
MECRVARADYGVFLCTGIPVEPWRKATGLIAKQDDILKVRDKIAGRGARVHADHVVGMVSRIYSWAVDEE